MIKKFSWFLLCVLFLTACEESLMVLPSDLPLAAQTFVEQHFANDNIDYAVCEKEMFHTEYTVILSGGFRLEFEKDGTCKKVDCRPQAVPNSIVPPIALQYVQNTFPNSLIVSYEFKERQRYELELNNNIELLFDKNGQIIKMDD
ncbi:MAG: PepSY-like domain-containing protein [Bacteroidales bacterium]|nr:PepSY-like domain-containing protein [Bacteroidales bacterium]